MKNFFNQLWVQITAWVFVVLGVIVLIIGGTGAASISQVVELVSGIIGAIGVLIITIKKLLEKKESSK